MEPDTGGAEIPRPTTSDLIGVMSLLRVPSDAAYLVQDHLDARARAELLAHVSAWIVDCLRQAETQAGLAIDDAADLHWRADLAAGSRGRPLLSLQIDRLEWVHQTMTRARPRQPDITLEVAAVTVGAIVQLLTTWHDDRRDGGIDPADLLLTDGVLALGEAADRLLRTLREHRSERY